MPRQRTEIVEIGALGMDRAFDIGFRARTELRDDEALLCIFHHLLPFDRYHSIRDWSSRQRLTKLYVMSTGAVLRLDLRGLKCPLPVLHTQKRLDRLGPGERVIVECTDPLSMIDIPHLVQVRGDVLEEKIERDGLYVFHIRARYENRG